MHTKTKAAADESRVKGPFAVGLSFAIGLVLGATMLAMAWGVRHSESGSLMGGWRMPASVESEIGDNVPVEFDFGAEYVTLRTADNSSYKCAYEVQSEDVLDRRVIIQDYLGSGKSVTLTYSIQPMVHIEGVDEDNQSDSYDYLFIG